MNLVQISPENGGTQPLKNQDLEQKIKRGDLQGRTTTVITPSAPAYVLVGINDPNDKEDEIKTKELEKNLKQKKFRKISLGASGLSCLTGLVFVGAASLTDNTPCWIIAAILEALGLGNYLGTYYCYPCTKLPDDVIDHISLE